jgi:hypothetical protein
MKTLTQMSIIKVARPALFFIAFVALVFTAQYQIVQYHTQKVADQEGFLSAFLFVAYFAPIGLASFLVIVNFAAIVVWRGLKQRGQRPLATAILAIILLTNLATLGWAARVYI